MQMWTHFLTNKDISEYHIAGIKNLDARDSREHKEEVEGLRVLKDKKKINTQKQNKRVKTVLQKEREGIWLSETAVKEKAILLQWKSENV